MSQPRRAEVIIVGGGIAGLSAAIYLGRAKRETLVIDAGKSMARWEPDVQNYLGFPGGISGEDLLRRGRKQARCYGVKFVRDNVITAGKRGGQFFLHGEKQSYLCRRVLLATGIFHIPPNIPGVKLCLGHSMFFCKDCDGYRVQNRSIAIYGWSNETVDYALGMLAYSRRVVIVTDGHKPRWSRWRDKLICEREIPVYREIIRDVRHSRGQIQALIFNQGAGVSIEGLFTTRGDIYFSKLAETLGAGVNKAGEIVVRMDMRTTVPGVYAAGCVTPANCQMIIAAGQGAAAAQAINRNLFDENLGKPISPRTRHSPTFERRKARHTPIRFETRR
jgi:thioredoxin reductase (NADPH)